jgi:predicted GNAT family acetyltransferase
MSGAQSIFDKIIPHLNGFKIQPMYFCEAFTLNEEITNTNLKIVKVKTKEHCSMLFDALVTIDEFGYIDKSKEEFIESKLKSLNMGSTFFIEEEGIVLSTVATTAETTKSAMVVAVATIESARSRGLASILMKHLMNEYFEVKGKYLCLFYDNPKAGNIYKRLGFKDVDKWVMLTKE